MKLSIFVCLTFLLSSQRSGSDNPLKPFSSKVCTSEECKRAAEMLRGNMARWEDPCDDFYSFACGRFFNNGNLDEMRTRRSNEIYGKVMGILNSDNDRNIRAIAKIQQIFRLCKDEDAIKQFGDNVIQLQFNNVGLPSMPPFHPQKNTPNNFGGILAKLHRNAAIPFLFSVDVIKDTKDYRINRLYILLDFEAIIYIKQQLFSYEINRKNRYKHLKEYMMGVVKQLYQIEEMSISDEILELVSGRVDEVVQFLLSAVEVLQEYMYTPPNDEYITIQELQEKTDKILHNTNIKFNWLEYLLQLFENMFDNVEDYFGSGEPLIVKNMNYLMSIFEVISRIDAEVFKASLWWVTVNDVIDIAYEELFQLHEKFEEKSFRDTWSRESMCLKFAKERYSHAFTHLLLQEENLQSAISNIYELNEKLKDIFIETIENASWMDESTREEAKRKVYYMKTFISHESWVEKSQKIESKYAGVTIEYSWYETRLKENVRVLEEKLKLLFVTNKKNREQFPLDLLNSSINYNYTKNVGGIPFALLGLPFFNYGLDSMNYGSIGFYLGYLITLPLDETGRKTNYLGIKKNWWKKSTLQEFNNRAKCFVDFYSKFNVNGREIKTDGKRTLNSNISDNVAMKLVLSAYEEYEHNYVADTKLTGFEGYSSKQLLTLAMANTMCSSVSPEDFYERYEKVHLSEYHQRVNGIFMNSKKMSDIWGCSEESQMNSENKCYIW